MSAPPPTAANPLDAFDFDDGLPHIVADHERLEVADHLLSPSPPPTHDDADDALRHPMTYLLWDDGPADAAGGDGQGGEVDVAGLLSEDIGEWPLDANQPPPQMTKMMDRHVHGMVHAPRDEVGRQGRIKPRIKLSLKARNKPAAEDKLVPKEAGEEDEEWVPVQERRRGKKKASSKGRVHKKRDPTSKYNGVSMRNRHRTVRFEAKLRQWHVGTYVLEADAALAYDKVARGIGVERFTERINFQTKSEYEKAREGEMLARNLSEDLDWALIKISKKVDKVLEKAQEKGMQILHGLVSDESD